MAQLKCYRWDDTDFKWNETPFTWKEGCIIEKIINYGTAPVRDRIKKLTEEEPIEELNKTLVSYIKKATSEIAKLKNPKDPMTRKSSVADFNYNDYFSKSKTLNKASVTTDYKNRFGSYMIDVPPQNMEAGMLRMSVVNSTQSNLKYIKDRPGSTTKNLFIERTLPFRVSQLELSRYHRLRITVPGQNELCVGMVVNLQIDTTTATNSNSKERYPDPILSGNYLVSSIRHVITGQTTYISVIEVIKDSGRGGNLAHFELVTHSRVEEVFALRVERSAHAPCVGEGKQAF